MDDIVQELRENAELKQGEAWRRMDGGQDLCIGAALAERAADEMERLRVAVDGYKEQVESAINEIVRVKQHSAAEIDQMRAALKPFAYYYDLNDCVERDPRLALEVPISDLAAAKRAYEQSAPQER